ncbi:hypothetical protein [Cupriavidus necator]|uniref:hypothetical protein n=1 Tax=Cupriavidus necator TaxID=106590 RepID=UPI002783DEF3|nr:hypothetical protein [Cupriavidus necator]MDQ0140960.1 hypothetical protein [Cupriavidus necator]
MTGQWVRFHYSLQLMPLSSTQIGAIGENLLVNAVMKASDGRLSPFQPLADGDGIDVLFFDKEVGNAVAIQLKCRTVTLYKAGTKERGNLVHFELKKTTFNQARRAYLVAALCDEALTGFEVTWFIPMSHIPLLARDSSEKWVIRPEQVGEQRGPVRILSLRIGRGPSLPHRRSVRSA